MSAYSKKYLGSAEAEGAKGDMSASFNAPWVPVKGNGDLSLDIAWSNGTGTYSLQCTFDGGTTARTVPGASTEFTANGNAHPAGSSGSMVVNFRNVPGTMWRLVYTRSAGSGTTTATYSQR